MSTNQVLAGQSASSGTNAPAAPKLFDPKDGWLDIGDFLDTAYGFVPLVMPITEPAVGYGAGGGLVFIDRKEQKPDGQFQKPNMTAIGGAGTENGTWAAFGGHSGSWLEGKLETLAFLGYGSVNLDFYGIGDGALNDQPVGYNLEPLGGMVEARYRLGQSPVRAGLRYAFATTRVTFSGGTLPPQVVLPGENSRVSGFTPTITYDTRNNLFTPTKGVYAQVGVGVYNEVFASDFNYEAVNLAGIFYLPLASTLTLGLRAEGNLSFDSAPFYALPFISLRGVAVRRYVGEHAGEVEAEARWQLWKRFSLVVFTGAGVAWNNFERLQNKQTVITGGTGFRYELARKHGLHMGLDVAFGPDEPAIYLQFGSAWFRP